jgi:hypothetical protein
MGAENLAPVGIQSLDVSALKQFTIQSNPGIHYIHKIIKN